MTTDTTRRSLLESVAQQARHAGVFGAVAVTDAGLVCAARDADAEYRLGWEDARLWVSLVTPDRWLSESIEADLMHTGDDIEELLEEELVEQGVEASRPAVEHFRSEDRLFTFRSPVSREDPMTAIGWLLAYEACFRSLGDMAGAGDDD